MLINDYVSTRQVKGLEIPLDLQKEDLFGFHKTVGGEIVNQMLESIEAGKEFRHVYVVRHGNSYYLTCLVDLEQGRLAGGHHRAYVHYRAGKPLKCEIVDSSLIATNSNINIRDIVLKSQQ